MKRANKRLNLMNALDQKNFMIYKASSRFHDEEKNMNILIKQKCNGRISYMKCNIYLIKFKKVFIDYS